MSIYEIMTVGSEVEIVKHDLHGLIYFTVYVRHEGNKRSYVVYKGALECCEIIRDAFVKIGYKDITDGD